MCESHDQRKRTLVIQINVRQSLFFLAAGKLSDTTRSIKPRENWVLQLRRSIDRKYQRRKLTPFH